MINLIHSINVQSCVRIDGHTNIPNIGVDFLCIMPEKIYLVESVYLELQQEVSHRINVIKIGTGVHSSYRVVHPCD